MPRPSIAELAAALYGLVHLARLDSRGFDYFDATPTGLLKSFWVAVALLPIFVIYLALDLAMLDVASVVHPVRYVTVELTAYVIDWVAFPLAMLSLAPFLGLDDRLFRFLVPLNWIQLPLGLMLMGPGLMARLVDMPEDAANLMGLTIISAALIITAALARYAMDVPWWSAAGMTLLNFTISLFVTGFAYSLASVG